MGRAGSGLSILDSLDLLATGTKNEPIYPDYVTGNEFVIEADMDSIPYHIGLFAAGNLQDKVSVDATLANKASGAGAFTVAATKAINNKDSIYRIWRH